MTSTIKVNNIQNQCGANIINESSNTITIGASGDTVSLASGASQSGFGRTGSVDWQTTKKTATFTATSGEGYFCDTSGGAFTLTLPSSPSAGDIVGFKDYSGNFATNNLTIGRGGAPINGGSAVDPAISTEGASIFLVYVDGTQGWIATQDDSSTFSGEDFLTATGGAITTDGNFKIHTFTGPGTFTVCSVSATAANNVVDYLVVAGGGAGGYYGGGGGAGGLRYYLNTTNSPTPTSPALPINNFPSGTAITVTATGFPITVGGGGAGSPLGPPQAQPTNNGSNSVFSTITSAGGGAGGEYGNPTGVTGKNGGSGGAGGASEGTCGALGGSGNTPPVNPSQGNDGGSSGRSGPSAYGPAGGGGGAWGSGPGASGSGGSAGPGGGGTGGSIPGPTATAGTANTGGGGGGGAYLGSNNNEPGKAGGSGIVVIRYRFQ